MGTSTGNISLDPISRRHHQNRVVNWRTHLDPALGREAACQAQHLAAVALHGEIPQRSRV
jgi:hypothetical protein